MKRHLYGALAVLLATTAGCSLQKMAIRQMTPMLPEGITAFEEETDYEFAQSALGGQIKFLETLFRNDPKNLKLRILLARSYASYAFLFFEENGRALELTDPDQADRFFARASEFFGRSRDYGLDALRERKGFAEAMAKGVGDEGIAALKAHLATYGPKDVELLFWTAFGWGSVVNLSRDDIETLADAPRADAIMQRVLELDPAYYNAAPHLYFALLNGAKPEALGGKPDLSKEHFESALRLSGGDDLLIDVFYARYYGVQTQNRELYLEKLERVRDAPDDLNPRQALANVLAKRKAVRLLEDVDEYF